MTSLPVFDDIVRTDRAPARAGEARFDFLNRSGSEYFGYVRDTIEQWFSHIPAEEKASMRGALRAANDASAAAYWELYLHEGYRRSGYEIDVHPEIPDRSKRPDFCMRRGGEIFYLEAVSVGRESSEVAEERRLDQVHRVLAEMQIENFTLVLSTYEIGPNPLSTRQLRNQLRSWVGDLDPVAEGFAAEVNQRAGFDRLPRFRWKDAGWSLEFHAVPLNEDARNRPHSALGATGSGEAVMVDNKSGIRRVLDSKYKKYGELDHPLVIAVQSNTEYPTRDYEFEQALFGLSASRPEQSAAGVGRFLEDGFWIGGSGWRNQHVPQVIAIGGLAPWSFARSEPCVWTTLQEGVDTPTQPDWIAPMIVGEESERGFATPTHEHFEVAVDWPGMAAPDFDVI